MNIKDYVNFGRLSQDFTQTRFEGRPYFTHDDVLREAPQIFYVRNRWNKLRTRLQENYTTVMETVEEYNKYLMEVLTTFQPLLTSYDWDVVLPNTCALGMMKPHHFNVMALDHFYPKRNHVIPSEYVDALWEYYKGSFDPNYDAGLSMPRGRNTGWPTPRGIRSRDLSDALLAAHAALAIGAKARGFSLAQLADCMQRMYGQWFSIAGERYQHSAKDFPVITAQGPFASKNAEPRVRGIYFSPKFAVIFNRPAAKKYLHMILGSDIHTQDRVKLKKGMADLRSKFDFVISLDVSGYDQGMGGESLLSIVNVLGEFAKRGGLDGEAIVQDFLTELQVPLLIPTQSGMYMSDTVPILPSGAAETTVVGCTGSAYILTRLVATLYQQSPLEVAKNRGRTWGGYSYGDDMVLGLKTSLISNRYKHSNYEETLQSIQEIGASELQFKFDDEPTLKFLGQNYDMRSYTDSPIDYPIGRFIQQQFFPERVKIGAFARIGYIARLELVNEAVRKELHDRMRSTTLWDRAGLGAPFAYSEREKVLKEAVIECQKQSDKISQLDDILGVFTHGLQPDDIEFDLGMFEDLIGISSIDVSDPASLVDNHLQRYVKPVVEGRYELFPDLIMEISRMFSLPVYNSYEVMV